MARYKGNPGNGPAKGPGNGNAKAKPYTKDDGDNPGSLAVKMRHYREKKQREDPTWQPAPRPPNSREFSEMARGNAPEAMAILMDIAANPKQLALARVRAAEIIIERGHGKAPLTIQHERKLEELTDAELVAELARIAEENGITIEADPGSYRVDGGVEEAGKQAVLAPLGGDSDAVSLAEAAAPALPAPGSP
jgi:hypothetical protein